MSDDAREAGETDERLLDGWRIVVLSYGWVLVGALERVGSDFLLLRRAGCIRRWGTAEGDARGLGRLASGGPTRSTVIDWSPDCEIPLASVVYTLRTEAALWQASIPSPAATMTPAASDPE